MQRKKEEESTEADHYCFGSLSM